VRGLDFPGDAENILDGNFWIWTVRVEIYKEYKQPCMRGEGIDLLLPGSKVSCCFALATPTQASCIHPGGHLLHVLLGQDLALSVLLVSPAGNVIFSSENTKCEQEEQTSVSGEMLYLNHLLPNL